MALQHSWQVRKGTFSSHKYKITGFSLSDDADRLLLVKNGLMVGEEKGAKFAISASD